MKTLNYLSLSLFFSIFLISCASTGPKVLGAWAEPTQYQEADAKGYGYDFVASPDGVSFGCYFIGTFATRPEVAMRYAFTACAELAEIKNFTHFKVIADAIDSKHPISHKNIAGVVAKIMVKMYSKKPNIPGAFAVDRVLLKLPTLSRKSTRRPARLR